ncbi:MAG: hypothetical protein A3G21_00150 [Acidobacteria bacterium RIFCSPLOWO2_12_FULL_66_21]|nr:MAG: hypothetical protein A3G21_00150 [Acidobacteria bacterium RIFCSPLOWO2_12_FULL_66_21]
MIRIRGGAARHAALAVAVSALLVVSVSGQNPPPQKPQQPPVFRTEANYVHVDAYPTRDGKIVEGLTAADFEVLEDGKPQTIDAVQFIRFEPFTSDAERRDPNSQREAFELAGDPRYRVFVIYLDFYHTNLRGSHETRKPLTNMLNRILGSRDLFGMLTPQQRPTDLILGQHTESIAEQLERHWTWGFMHPAEGALELEACGLPQLAGRRNLDKVFSDLEGLIDLLDGIRQERKNILLFSGGFRLPGRDTSVREGNVKYDGPTVGITPTGKITLGSTGRPGEADPRWCQSELNRLAEMDFGQRWRNLIRAARQANVAFYTINPQGLEAAEFAQDKPVPFINGQLPGGNPVVRKTDAITDRTDRLLELAQNTDGVAVVNSNDINPGLARIASDLSAYYVLGYYTTNTKWDGRVRKISVRLKGTNTAVRARREYRAPTEAEMATMRAALSTPAVPKAAPPEDAAFATLVRMRPDTTVLAHGVFAGSDLVVVTEIAAPAIEVGRWKGGADVEVTVGDAAGATVATGRGRIEPGARAALVRVPVGGQPGPWTAAVEVRAAGEPDQHDRIRIARAAGPLGDPLVYRALPAPVSPLRPAAVFQFRRTERIHLEWPILQPLDRREARLLGRNGSPLALEITLAERETNGAPMLVADLNLAPLTAGDYAIDLTAGSGAAVAHKVMALRVVR